MERLRRVASLWSWLPAFRAVAETQHLPTASRQLFVSASALSRTIRLLEEDLGQPLFLRHGRRIELNEAGQRLLAAVRDAMRLIHESIQSVQSSDLDGPVYVSSESALTDAIVFPALARLRSEHPALVPEIATDPLEELAGLLLRGQIDVAFVSGTLPDGELARLHVGTASNGIYCGRGHPLFDVNTPTDGQLEAAAFVTLRPDERGVARDPWPPKRSRTLGLVVSDLGKALEACARGHVLAVLPDAVAGAEHQRDRLRRLPFDFVPPTDVFAYKRKEIGVGGRAEAVIDGVVAALDDRRIPFVTGSRPLAD